MNIVPLATDAEPLKLTDLITVGGTLVALLMSGFALWWQRRLLDRQLKHELYEKRLDVYRRYQEMLNDLNPMIALGAKVERASLIKKQAQLEQEAQFLFGAEVREQLQVIHEALRQTISNVTFLQPYGSPADAEDAVTLSLAPLMDAMKVWVQCGPLIASQLQLYNDPMTTKWRRKLVTLWKKPLLDTKSPPPAN